MLRPWLCRNGYMITGEYLIEEEGRIYEILTATAGETPAYTEAEFYVGRFEQLRTQPLAKRRLEQLIGRLERALCGLENAQNQENNIRRDYLWLVKKELCRMSDKL